MSWNTLDLAILAPAFCAGLLVLATHVPLGAQVLKKGIVFIDLAIAQIAALGVIGAGMFDIDPGGWQVQGVAALAALGGALLLTWTEKVWPEVQEAQIGVLFVLAATAGILLLSKNPHGGEHLRDLLAGQILWVSFRQLAIPFVAALLTLVLLFGFRERLPQLGFYLLFALAVTVSVQLVGVYLVFATLIVPSLGVRDYPQHRRLPLAYAIATFGYGIGLVLSSALDLPSGALIVWCVAVLAVITHALAPRPGADRPSAAVRKPGHWLLQDAKARFSELVRRVRSEGPQHVTLHGREEVVVISVEEFRRLRGNPTGQALVEAMEASPHPDIDIEPVRAPMSVREVNL